MKLFSWIALGLMATTEASKYQSKNFENREKLPKKRSFSRDSNIKLVFLYVYFFENHSEGPLVQIYQPVS